MRTAASRRGPPQAHQLLRWIEGAGRRVVNGSGASTLRGDRGDRLRALTDAILNTPRFVEITRREELADAARSLRTPLLLHEEHGAQLFRVDGHGELSHLARDRSLPRTGRWLLEELLPAGPRAGGAVRVRRGRLETMDRAKHTALFDDRRQLRPLRGDEQAQLARTPLVARLARFLEERRIDIAAAEVAALPGSKPFVYELEINPVCHGPAGAATATATATARIVSFLSSLLDLSRSERSRS